MNLTDNQHCDWFIATLLPRLRFNLSQKKIGTQAKELEITMRLHEALIQDVTLVVQQIHVELHNLYLEF